MAASLLSKPQVLMRHSGHGVGGPDRLRAPPHADECQNSPSGKQVIQTDGYTSDACTIFFLQANTSTPSISCSTLLLLFCVCKTIACSTTTTKSHQYKGSLHPYILMFFLYILISSLFPYILSSFLPLSFPSVPRFSYALSFFIFSFLFLFTLSFSVFFSSLSQPHSHSSLHLSSLFFLFLSSLVLSLSLYNSVVSITTHYSFFSFCSLDHFFSLLSLSSLLTFPLAYALAFCLLSLHLPASPFLLFSCQYILCCYSLSLPFVRLCFRPQTSLFLFSFSSLYSFTLIRSSI